MCLQAEDAKNAVQDTFSESTGDKAERKTKGEPHVRGSQHVAGAGRAVFMQEISPASPASPASQRIPELRRTS